MQQLQMGARLFLLHLHVTESRGLYLYVDVICLFIPLLKLVNSLEREPDIGYAMLRFSHKSGQEPLVSLDIDLIQLTLNE